MTAASGRTPKHLSDRHRRLRELFAKLKVDAALLTSPEDVSYLTDFTGHDSTVLLTPDQVIFISDFRYAEQIRRECPWVRAVIREGTVTMSQAIADAAVANRATAVGFEANFTTFGLVKSIEKQIKTHKTRGKRPALKPMSDVVVNLRKVKDSVEIAIIREAVKCAEGAYHAVRASFKVGHTENEIAGRLFFELRKRGAADSSFETIIAAGANSSLPHYRPHDVPVKKNAPLLFDWGALYGGYCSDLTRTHAVGKVPARFRQIYDVVLESQLAAIEAIRPGARTGDVDKVARNIISKAGFGKEFGHGLGHGIGRAIHELPAMRKTGADEPLQPGNVVTVEPGIYIPGLGGVRIEDDVLVTPNGCEVLSSLPKRFEDCQIE